MKRILKTLALCVAAGVAVVSCNSDKYTITGNIANLPDQKVILNRAGMAGLEPIDTVECVDGKFIFTGKLPYNDYRIITFEDVAGEIDMYIDNSDIEVTGDFAFLDSVDVKGSDAMDYFLTFSQRAKDIQQYYKDQLVALQQAQQAEDTVKVAALSEEIIGKQKDYINENLALAETRPEDFISFFVVLNSSVYATPERIKAYYDKVPEYIKSDPRVQEATSQLNKIMSLSHGNPVPEFELHSIDSDVTITTDSLKGKTSLVYITTTEVANNDHVYSQLKKAHDAGLNVVICMMLMTQDQVSVMGEYRSDMGLEDYDVVLVDENFVESMGAVTPRVFAVDADAKFIKTAVEPEDIEALVNELTAQK